MKGRIAWPEPLRNWIEDAEKLNDLTETTPPPVKKSYAKKIFGSDLFLSSHSPVFTPASPYASLREARENFSEKTLA